jgi:hypothetical protein
MEKRRRRKSKKQTNALFFIDFQLCKRTVSVDPPSMSLTFFFFCLSEVLLKLPCVWMETGDDGPRLGHHACECKQRDDGLVLFSKQTKKMVSFRNVSRDYSYWIHNRISPTDEGHMYVSIKCNLTRPLTLVFLYTLFYWGRESIDQPTFYLFFIHIHTLYMLHDAHNKSFSHGGKWKVA